MYLTASRPDLVFAMCMCARYHASPTKKHLEALKWVFRYLIGTINWGLWYPKDTAIALTAYADADHAGRQDIRRNNMANENVPAPAPTRSDDQILPFAAWVPIRKSNFVLDYQKRQKNPIFQISVDILQNTNFFRAFTASASVLAIYIQQFWNILTYEAKTGVYSKTSGFDRPRYPVLHMLWGIITSTNVDYAELMWEELVQAIQTFLTDKANLGSPTKKGIKDKPHVIPYCRFTKLIIYHLGRKHNLHQRSESPLHLAEEDLRLGNLKFIPKGGKDEVFGMLIPNVLITDSIRNAPYYEVLLGNGLHNMIVTLQSEKVEGKEKLIIQI
ncbi:hypothetical protein Tco_0058701 [Tanacetum coccineum]